ncbi:MAG: toprim domain-containing protein [Chloroflexi bacterium]|nr:toprim domain-containing protein [Chloroflexota bacterium]
MRSRTNPTRVGTRKTRDEIEAIRANHPIEQVIGRYVELRPSGRRLMGQCPFHDDPTPSFVVYVHNQSWYCFGCDVGGDVFKFIERIEKVSFAQALQRLSSNALAARPVSRVPTTQAKPIAPIELSDEHFTLLTAATEVYHAAIFAQPRVLEYLAERRIDLDMIRRHRIGYATGNDLAKYFRFRGWDPEIASDLGLIGPRGEYFRERIVIPELRDGRAIYLVGRATQEYQRAKYLGLPGAPKPLYGLEMIRGSSDVFICEGPLDWLTLVKWGYHAVALLGSHLKRDQISAMSDAERIFIVTDSDEPGRKSARRLAETFGERARIVPPLPNAKDVNELAMRLDGHSIFAGLVQPVAQANL